MNQYPTRNQSALRITIIPSEEHIFITVCTTNRKKLLGWS